MKFTGPCEGTYIIHPTGPFQELSSCLFMYIVVLWDVGGVLKTFFSSTEAVKKKFSSAEAVKKPGSRSGAAKFFGDCLTNTTSFNKIHQN